MKTPSQVLLALVRPDGRQLHRDVRALHRVRALQFEALGRTWTWHTLTMPRRIRSLMRETAWRRVCQEPLVHWTTGASGVLGALVGVGVSHHTHSAALGMETLLLSALGTGWVSASQLVSRRARSLHTSEARDVYQEEAHALQLPEIEPGLRVQDGLGHRFTGINRGESPGLPDYRASDLLRLGIYPGMATPLARQRLEATLDHLHRQRPGDRGDRADAVMSYWDSCRRNLAPLD